MFKANTNHNQNTLFDSTLWMNPRICEKLDKSWAPIFYEQIFCKIDEAPFSVLYGTTGNPNFPVNILLSLEYIKHMRQCNDLELLDSFYFDYLVNYAVGIRTLGDKNLAERTLYYFRERIYNYCLENPLDGDLLFEQFLNLLKNFSENAGVSMDEQRTDTTLFMSNIKKAGRISLAYDVLVKLVKAIPEDRLTSALASVLEPKYKTDTLYRAKAQDSDSRLAILLDTCKEALDILESLPGMLESDEVRIGKRFLREQSTTVDDTGKLKPKKNKEISPSSLQSAYDEDATYRKKANVSQSGYVLEITETCEKDNPFQLLTDYSVESNNTSDVEILKGRIEEIRENTGCTDMYVDGGFHSEAVHQAADSNGIKIHMTNMSGTEPTNKLPMNEFDIDEVTKIINKCPGGYVPTHAGVSSSQTSAHFPHEACSNCEFRERCYSKAQVKDCVVRINLKSIDVSRIRVEMKADIVENTSKRAGIEGSNSALKRKGLDKLAVRGMVKSKIVCGLMVTAQNIKRFVKYIQGGYKQQNANIPPNGIIVPING